MNSSRGTAAARTLSRSASVELWDTEGPEPSGFAEAWEEALAESPHAHFALRMDFLRWSAARGRRCRALRVEDASKRGVIVQRLERGRWVSGWPWRWQSLVCGSDPDHPAGMTPADAAWLHEQAALEAGGETVLHYLPHPPARRVPGWIAGATIVQDLAHTDRELFDGMEPSKRRQAKRALQHELTFDVARSPEEFQSFARLQMHQGRPNPASATGGGAGPSNEERWREWELPWMWLLLARRNQDMIAGVGDGISPGGSMQGRTTAYTTDARRMGATVLLGYEEMRRGRDLGHRWFNYGGDTPFKREMSGRLGRRVRIFGWLGGGRGRGWWHFGEATFRQLRPTLAGWRRRIGSAGAFAATTALDLSRGVPPGAEPLLGF